MTPEQAKDRSVHAIDSLLDSRVARWSMSADDVRLARATRSWFMAGAPDGLVGLARYYEAEPARAATQPYPAECPKCNAALRVSLCLVCTGCDYVEELVQPVPKEGIVSDPDAGTAPMPETKE